MKVNYLRFFLNIQVTFHDEFCILHGAQCAENAKPTIFFHFSGAMKMTQYLYLEVIQ